MSPETPANQATRLETAAAAAAVTLDTPPPGQQHGELIRATVHEARALTGGYPVLTPLVGLVLVFLCAHWISELMGAWGLSDDNIGWLPGAPSVDKVMLAVIPCTVVLFWTARKIAYRPFWNALANLLPLWGGVTLLALSVVARPTPPGRDAPDSLRGSAASFNAPSNPPAGSPRVDLSEVRHVTHPPDGSVIHTPGEPVISLVRLYNAGTTRWIERELCREGGRHDSPAVQGPECFPIRNTDPGDSAAVVLEFTAPQRRGPYEVRYKMQDSNGDRAFPDAPPVRIFFRVQ